MAAHGRYNFDMRGAYESGDHRHPQIIIRSYAPDAYDFEPVPIGDCWLFSAPALRSMPSFIRDITDLERPRLGDSGTAS